VSVTTAELAERYGTPLYVYDLDRVTEARDDLLATLPEGFDLYYALKANPHPEVVRAVREGAEEVCRAEVSSLGELDAALAAGHPADRCLYTGPGKTDTELDRAIGLGVRTFSAESPSDLQHIGNIASRHGVIASCILRLNIASAGTATGIRMMGRPSQFGIDGDTLAETLPQLLSVPGTTVVGAHLFTMSNAADEENLLVEYEHVVETAARLGRDLGLPLKLLDIGGGFAAPYAVPGSRTPYPKLRTGLADLLDKHLPEWRAGRPRLACESGRYLAAECGSLVVRVVNVKEGRGGPFVLLDAGINALGGLSGIGRLLPAAVELEPGQRPVGRGTLAGPLCTPGDSLGRNVELPPLVPGDLVTIPNVGAYGLTASLVHFLSRPAPVEVTLHGGEVVSATRLEPRRTLVEAGQR